MRCVLFGLTVCVVAAPASAQEMVQIPAGEFIMGSERGDPDERPVRKVQLPAFSIDRLEVTQSQYSRCMAAGACKLPRKYPESIGPNLPAVGVTWHDAARYCAWAGKRLPTEAEWERAARGTDGRNYPWGKEPDCARANFGSFLGDGPCGEVNPGRVLPVGGRPRGASPEGVQDLAGNVWEWVTDRYAPYPAPDPPKGKAPRRRMQPAQEVEQRSPPVLQVVRGGSCCSYFAMPTTTNRLAFPADYADNDLGFRCAR